MESLLSYHTSDGEKGKCGPACWDAMGPDCNCICGGLNHGKGFEVAKANVAELAKNMIADFLAVGKPELREKAVKFTVFGKPYENLPHST